MLFLWVGTLTYSTAEGYHTCHPQTPKQPVWWSFLSHCLLVFVWLLSLQAFVLISAAIEVIVSKDQNPDSKKFLLLKRQKPDLWLHWDTCLRITLSIHLLQKTTFYSISSSLSKPMESSNIPNDSFRAKCYFFVCIAKAERVCDTYATG